VRGEGDPGIWEAGVMRVLGEMLRESRHMGRWRSMGSLKDEGVGGRRAGEGWDVGVINI